MLELQSTALETSILQETYMRYKSPSSASAANPSTFPAAPLHSLKSIASLSHTSPEMASASPTIGNQCKVHLEWFQQEGRPGSIPPSASTLVSAPRFRMFLRIAYRFPSIASTPRRD